MLFEIQYDSFCLTTKTSFSSDFYNVVTNAFLNVLNNVSENNVWVQSFFSRRLHATPGSLSSLSRIEKDAGVKPLWTQALRLQHGLYCSFQALHSQLYLTVAPRISSLIQSLFLSGLHMLPYSTATNLMPESIVGNQMGMGYG